MRPWYQSLVRPSWLRGHPAIESLRVLEGHAMPWWHALEQHDMHRFAGDEYALLSRSTSEVRSQSKVARSENLATMPISASLLPNESNTVMSHHHDNIQCANNDSMATDEDPDSWDG